MKTASEIAEDCGITRGGDIGLLASLRHCAADDENGLFPSTGRIIGALCRHIEKLENGPDEAEEGADVCSVCDAVFAPKTLPAINETEFELICPGCALARIKKLEAALAEIRDLVPGYLNGVEYDAHWASDRAALALREEGA